MNEIDHGNGNLFDKQPYRVWPSTDRTLAELLLCDHPSRRLDH